MGVFNIGKLEISKNRSTWVERNYSDLIINNDVFVYDVCFTVLATEITTKGPLIPSDIENIIKHEVFSLLINSKIIVNEKNCTINNVNWEQMAYIKNQTNKYASEWNVNVRLNLEIS